MRKAEQGKSKPKFVATSESVHQKVQNPPSRANSFSNAAKREASGLFLPASKMAVAIVPAFLQKSRPKLL
jgi:hypothetical protein